MTSVIPLQPTPFQDANFKYATGSTVKMITNEDTFRNKKPIEIQEYLYFYCYTRSS